MPSFQRIGAFCAAAAIGGAPIGAAAQDKDQLRAQAKASVAQLRAAGEPRDRCATGAEIQGDNVVTRTFGGSAFTPSDKVGNLDAVLLQRETPTGTFVASNAYGAKATVTKVTRLQQALFEGEADYRTNLFVDQKEGVDAELGLIPMTVPEAQAVKAGGRVAFVAKPKWPFYAEGTRTFDATITNPVEVTNPIQVIVADIQCGLLLSPTNRVLAAFTTR